MEQRYREFGPFWAYDIIDTHAHVSSDDFEEDRDAVIERARSAHVAFIEVGYDLESSRKSLVLSGRLGFYCSVGLHPHEAGEEDGVEEKWASIEGLFGEDNHGRIAAIGEIGLDYYRNLSPRESQVHAFVRGLRLARSRALPVIIHQRDAEKDLLDIVRKEHPGTNLIFHCFSQDKNYASEALDMGGYLGIGGVVTYPRNQQLRDVVASLPRNRVLIETDCPYLAPQSIRGRRNEPSFIVEVVSCLAQLWNVTECEVSELTRINALRAFKIEPDDGYV